MPKLNWDWSHANDVSYTEGSVLVPSAKAGLSKAVKDETAKFWGVCTSKSAFWVAKCYRQGPPRSRADFDGGTGVGISPGSIAAQAVQLAVGRHTVATGGNYQIDFHSKMAESHGLSCREFGEGDGFGVAHRDWIEKAFGTRGAYLVTLTGAQYVHTVGIWNQKSKSALFDAEMGQCSNGHSVVLEHEIGEFFPSDYPSLSSWELYYVAPK